MTNENLLQDAKTAARMGDLDKAAALFARLVKEDPSSEQGWLGLGFCFSEESKREYCFRRVLAINPNNLQAQQAITLLGNRIIPDLSPGTDLEIHRNILPDQGIPESGPPAKVSPFLPGSVFSENNIDQTNSISNSIQQGESGKEMVVKEIESIQPNQELSVAEDAVVSSLPPKKARPVAVLFWVLIAAGLISIAGIIWYLISSGSIKGMVANPFPTEARLPVASTTPTFIPRASATASQAPPTPTYTLQPTIQPPRVYSPVFTQSSCWFQTPVQAVVTCGYVTVPEDRENPKTRTIQLAVVIFHSTNPHPAPDPVVFLQGGPGGEAVRLSVIGFDVLVKPFLSKRDFIAFDQRGTGLSIPALGCDELEHVYRQDVAGQISPSSRDLVYVNAFRSCHGAMTIGGIDLNSYNTMASSDDLKDIVLSLGLTKVNLYAASYGTRLALVTMRDHAEIVRSVSLDSVVPIETRLFNEDPNRYNSSLQALFDSCAADLRCNTAFPDLKTVFWDLVDQLDATPVSISAPSLVGSSNEPVSGAELIGVTLSLLKTTRTIAQVPNTIFRIKAGDYSSFISMRSSLPYEFDGINMGVYISMICHEQILATTVQDLQSAMDTNHDLGKYFRLPFIGDAKTIFNSCKAWGSLPPLSGENVAVVSDLPTLILEGTFDPVTPPIFGKQVASKLSQSYYMEFQNQGHTPSATDTSGCAIGAMQAFIEDPETKPDMACLLKLTHVDYFIPQ
jgi:pimeloyl-ACP methyl ester carboxylesterase